MNLAQPSQPMESAAAWLRLDCRHYRGDRPCNRGIQGACPAPCDGYEPLGPRVLIIKLGALGDVIRTTSILPAVREQWPGCQVTWVTRPNGVRMLKNHPLIDRLAPFDSETLCHLEYERFDVCMSLDKEPGPAALAMRVDARERRGMGISASGAVFPLNASCARYFLLGLDDGLKFHQNQLSYPRLIHEAIGLPYERTPYTLYPGPREQALAAAVWQRLGVGPHERVIGLNTGAGRVFANKNWPRARFARLARRLMDDGCRVALLGGRDEAALNEGLARECPGVLLTGHDHEELVFAALVGRCNALVTGDTMALHVGVGMRVPVVALFGPTCAQEIDLFDHGEKIVTGLACSPCYRRTCDVSPNCMEDIEVERVLQATRRWARSARNPSVPLPVLAPR